MFGSVAALSDVNNVIVERYSYDVFGAPTIFDVNSGQIPQSAIGNPYMFTARSIDHETGLYYYRARMYNSVIGRFLQTDPTGYADGLNMYNYVANNPLNWVDPYGLCKGSGWNWFQGGLDFVGIFDPTGISDAVNALIYLGRGQFGNAGISALAIIPFIGDIGKGGKYGAKALKYSDETIAFIRGAENGTSSMKFLPATKFEQHHIFPQKFVEDFKKMGIDIDNFAVDVQMNSHRSFSNKYNKDWGNFLNTRPNQKEIYQYGGHMMDKYGISGQVIKPYNR